MQNVARNPHLPAVAPPGFPARKVTGEAGSGTSTLSKIHGSAPTGPNRDEVPHLFLSLGAGITPAEGSVKPTAGFTFNSVYLSPLHRRPPSAFPDLLIS